MFKQVVVDLPEQRRNRSPQRQAPPPSSVPPTHPTAEPQAAEPAESEGDPEQGPILRRPFSSGPDGGVGWVEPDVVLSTFAATADDSSGMETDALKAQGVHWPRNLLQKRVCPPHEYQLISRTVHRYIRSSLSRLSSMRLWH